MYLVVAQITVILLLYNLYTQWLFYRAKGALYMHITGRFLGFSASTLLTPYQSSNLCGALFKSASVDQY